MTVAHDHTDVATTQALSGFAGMVGVTFMGQPGEQMMAGADVASAVEWNSPSVDFAALMDSRPGEEAGINLSSLYSDLGAAPEAQAPEGPAEPDVQQQQVRRNNGMGYS